jgi:uncharacterized membrane protein YsdA (DUF1294 family)
LAAGILIASASWGELWPIVVVLALIYLVLSVVTYVMYAVDKSAARRAESRRIPERNLHVVSILGGWPGAIVAQRTLRHKTQKRSFRRTFGLTVVANLMVLAAVIYSVLVIHPGRII